MGTVSHLKKCFLKVRIYYVKNVVRKGKNMKKLKSIIEKFVLMSFVAFAAALFIPIGVSASVTGSGTKSSPYVVDTYKDLSNTLYKGKKDETIYIRLGADISKSGYNGKVNIFLETLLDIGVVPL